MEAVALHTFYRRDPAEVAADPLFPQAHADLLALLEAGTLRAAEPDGAGGWRVITWVKQAILVGFRAFALEEQPGGPWPFFDKGAYPARQLRLDDGVRLVPGGSSVRRGAFLARGVVVMPQAYINVGAYVDEGTMVDSHAQVGSCAQIGKRVHLSAAAQVGGVLEPAGARPEVVEDEAFVGGLVGLFEGIHVGARAVLASGVVITGSTVIHDLVHGRTWQREVPEGAVVVPGSRPASGDYAAGHGLQLAAPVIVKYRDTRTDAATALEEALR